MKSNNVKKILFVLSAALGLFLFVFLFEQAFPTASIDLKLDRKQALMRAQEYVTALGYDVSGYHSSVVFSGDRTKFVFLEKCLGLLAANQLAKKEVPIWYWSVRFFKELEKEGFDVDVNPIGRIDGFSHYLEERASGEALSQDAAKKTAIEFLHNNGIFIENYETIESSSLKREQRTDHSFVWKKNESELTWKEGGKEGEGMQRLSVTVHGSRIGGFRAFFWTPEIFDRHIRKLFSEGRFLALISSFFYMMLYVAAIIMFIISFRKESVRYRLMVALALLIGIPNILNILNSIPLITAGYDTKVNFFVYYGSELISEFKGIINHVIVIIIVFCGGSFLARSLYKKQVEGLHMVLEGKRINRNTQQEILGGYLFAFMILGFVTLFYFLGMKYGNVWVFPSTRYSNILGTWFPFLLPLSLSLVAAISEEFIFRMFAISFLKKVLKITFLAVFIPSVIWAFAHSSYAVFPIYTRGIELTIVALAFSYVFLRYGILNCIVAHYVIDAVLFSLPLLRSSNAYFLMSGVIVIILAALPAGVSFLTRRETS
ncbi:MAG: CPBP family intramembrane metalloprotease [Candidatus Omnitrophica bacterium]|nr:CPBP family intramembrane metalloprotease [Candidatus Omnitrophota bacterium]